MGNYLNSQSHIWIQVITVYELILRVYEVERVNKRKVKFAHHVNKDEKDEESYAAAKA